MNLKFKDYPEKQMIEIEGINYSYELFKGFGGELKRGLFLLIASVQ